MSATLPDPNTLGGRIVRARRGMGMSQADLAGNDYSVAYISAVEQNKVRPSFAMVAYLASKLNISCRDILGGELPGI